MSPRTASCALLLLAVQLLLPSCTADLNNGFDHRAHAVLGGPYLGLDIGKTRDAVVRLNGELSHSHYFNTRTGVTGRIIKYEWMLGPRRLCATMKCAARFPRGISTVRLNVVDNTGDTASATIAVRVINGAKPGLRFWYFPGNPNVKEARLSGVPSVSRNADKLALHDIKDFPWGLRKGRFALRVVGDLSIDTTGQYHFQLKCRGGSCGLWVGQNKLGTGAFEKIFFKPTFFVRGTTHRLYVLYRRRDIEAPAPRLILQWRKPKQTEFVTVPKEALSHKPSVLRPVVNSVDPSKGAIGRVIQIYGSSFIDVKSVRIGNTECVGPVAKGEFVIKCVLPGGNGPQKLSVITDSGASNSVEIEIVKKIDNRSGSGSGSGKVNPKAPDPRVGGNPVEPKPDGSIGYYQPVKFTRTFLKKNGKTWIAGALTSIAYGPDGRYYLGSMEGYVHVITTTLGNEIVSECKSENVGPNRSILGVAFNPAITGKVVLYASSSVIHWETRNYLEFKEGWHNGEIIAMEKGNSNCLKRTQTVISGLPVSNYDHGVNHVAFDQSGNLLVTVGSTSNLGASKPGDPLGGVPDSPFSGCMIFAAVMKKGFNGKIKYNQYSNPQTANKISGDVSVYAAGVRNSFGFVSHSNGNIYATDNGANVEFGARSMGCNKDGEPRSEPDSLLNIKRGKWYGFANRNRGRFDARQCVHRSPEDTSGGAQRALTTLEPSTNGLTEFTANTFGAQLRGELFASKFAVTEDGGVYRIQLDNQGKVKSAFVFQEHSGLAIAMTPTGALFMPRVYQGKVAVLLPEEKNPGLLVVTSVFPSRGPKRGGSEIMVTGWNFAPPMSVTVGGKACKNVRAYKSGRSLKCTVPAGIGQATVVVRKGSKSSRSYGFEYMYMNI